MELRELVEGDLGLKLLNKGDVDLGQKLKGGYTSDLLSQVLASAHGRSVWLTIQNHMNIIGVATMVDVKAIVICENRPVSDDVIAKADEEGIALFLYDGCAFDIGGELHKMGL